jgi:DtxR family Mn-dependent transcriptional regulator
VASLTVENYVKMIYLISSRAGSETAVATGELSKALDVSPGTVTGMLKTLSKDKLATYDSHKGVRLTAEGQRLALTVLRRHRLLELFLVKTLHMHWDEIHDEAENLEHAVSERLVDRIDAYLGYPSVDPHGDPIPRTDGSLPSPDGLPLADLAKGDRFRLVRVVDQDSAFLRYLTECGLELDITGVLLENRAESGAVILKVGEKLVALGIDAARKVYVTEPIGRSVTS